MSNEFGNRMPPNDKAAEQSVLGAVFLNSGALIDAIEYLVPEDFYQHANQLIFKAMMSLNDRDEAIDTITMVNELKKTNELEDVGGPSYIAELAEAVPTASNVAYYAKIVKTKSTLRNLIAVASDVVTAGFDENGDLDEILEAAERNIMNVSEDVNQGGFKKISDVVQESMKEIEKLSQSDSQVTGLSTGFKDLDKITTGLHDDELIILAARPAVGKTAFALNIVQNVATKSKGTVAMFSLEMSADQLVNRMLCSEGTIDANHLRTGQLDDNEWQNLIVAMGSLSGTDIYIDDTPGIKIAEIRAKCRRLAKETGNLDMIIIDYLQLIEGTGQENRQQEVSAISRSLKQLAKELHVPVIALSQLSRGVEQRQDKRPVLSDIRESGSIEQDADIVAFLYRDDYYDEKPEDSDEQQPIENDSNVGEVEVIIGKNRSGARGTVKLMFAKSYNKFSNVSGAEEVR